MRVSTRRSPGAYWWARMRSRSSSLICCRSTVRLTTAFAGGGDERSVAAIGRTISVRSLIDDRFWERGSGGDLDCGGDGRAGPLPARRAGGGRDGRGRRGARRGGGGAGGRRGGRPPA